MKRSKPTWTSIQACKIAITRFYNEQYAYRVSALAFTTLLALVPFLFVIVFIMSLFPSFQYIATVGEKYVLMNFVPSSASAIQSYLQKFIHQASRLPTLSIAFLFVTTMMMVSTIDETLNDIWNSVERRNRVYSMLVFWCIIILMPILIGLGFFLMRYILNVTDIGYALQTLHLSAYLLNAIPVLTNTIIFSLLYLLVPNTHVPLKEGLLGGFVAAVLFESARFCFALYIKQFPSYEAIYGAFSIIPIFLLWIYIFWFIILFGGLFTHSRTSM